MTGKRTIAGIVVWGIAGFLAAGGVFAADIEGAGDHPEMSRVVGSYIVFQQESGFDRLTVPTGPWTGDAFESVQHLEGQVLRLSYNFENPTLTTLRMRRSYGQALAARGFEILFAGSEEELSGAGRTFFRQPGLFEDGRGRHRRIELVERHR